MIETLLEPLSVVPKMPYSHGWNDPISSWILQPLLSVFLMVLFFAHKTVP